MAIKVYGGRITLELGEGVMSDFDDGDQMVDYVRDYIAHNTCSEWSGVVDSVSGDIEWESPERVASVRITATLDTTVRFPNEDSDAERWADDNANALLQDASNVEWNVSWDWVDHTSPEDAEYDGTEPVSDPYGAAQGEIRNLRERLTNVETNRPTLNQVAETLASLYVNSNRDGLWGREDMLGHMRNLFPHLDAGTLLGTFDSYAERIKQGIVTAPVPAENTERVTCGTCGRSYYTTDEGRALHATNFGHDPS